MTMESFRRDMINFRVRNAQNRGYFHRANDMIGCAEQAENPANPEHEYRLRKALMRQAAEIAAAQRARGVFDPPAKRTRPYRKSR